jgi:hypothetical protein
MEPAIPKHHPGHPDTHPGIGGCECGGGGSVVEGVGIKIETKTGYSVDSESKRGILRAMKVVTAFFAASFLAFSVVTPSSGSPSLAGNKFANCTALNDIYPGGVAKNSKVTNMGGATNYLPVVKPKIYKANASKDRDKDGIACER